MPVAGDHRRMDDPSAQITDLYQRHAREWDSDRGRSLFEKDWLDRFLSGLPPGGSILDLGCGSAEPMARYIIGQGFRVTGVDAAPSLIDLCTSRFSDQEWIVGDMRSLSLGRGFDGILAWDSFFHLRHEDQRRMFDIFRRHAQPSTVLMFTSGPFHGEAIGTYRGEPLYHASLDPEEYRRLLAEHGFGVAEHVVEDPDCGGHTIWLARSR